MNPNYSEISGHRAYSSVLAIPEAVDLAVITLRAPLVPAVFGECVRKGVKFAVIFSSGFAEGGHPELEQEIKTMARNGSTRVVGPNCLGPYCPGSGLSFSVEAKPKEMGNVGFVSQSGGHSFTYKTLARSRGIFFNKILSLGNQSDLAIQEVLRYYCADPQVKVICAYLEQAKRGRDFAQVVREVARRKPLIIWKGGSTEDGARAAFSHTGAIASYSAVWRDSAAQLGFIPVDDLEEMSDIVFACISMPLPKGNRVAIVVAGGGSSVEMTDICARAGLGIPSLSNEVQAQIAPLIPEANTSCKNPVDLGFFGFLPSVYSQAIRRMARDGGIDALLLYQMTEIYSQFDLGSDWVELVFPEIARAREEIEIPVVAVIPPLEQDDMNVVGKRQNYIRKLRGIGIPVFPTVERAAKVLCRLQRYHRFLNS